uniref:NADH-cytochrome b5 reductase n=1 Tax=Haptolina brevifila TaxID=156173 RepID=A0A7S2JA51_9EUKA|eukprot:CAMPEP_0174736956 /NCGR_PEP_ID=MMETSP1094-20130205/67580_1 /TAXON_ID=156173 /ORGANISM="Chrysochromulina brevifilum, Strain UTEX LB 985" /LENGTH=291 /DNA_ID=CAMNT_0015940131 /DNA_START=56 /DNA_END=931 /DNA_ORIENTATION=-
MSFTYAPTTDLEHCSSCYLPTSWLALPLIEKREYNHDATVYAFGLPEGQSLQLPVCACILMKAPGKGRKEGGGKDDWDGSDAVRPYTPMSDNALLGRFELLVKRYEGGAASQYLHGLNVGASVEFKHIKFNIKKQYPFEGAKTISLICAGTGITPMFQALWKLLGTPGDDRKVVMLYGNKTVEDILMKEELDKWAKAHPDRLKLVHVVGNKPDDPAPPGWVTTPTYTAETGWIDEAKIKKYCFPPAPDTLLFVCGLPIMYKLLCGPRNEPELGDGTVLKNLGYTTQMIAKM